MVLARPPQKHPSYVLARALAVLVFMAACGGPSLRAPEPAPDASLSEAAVNQRACETWGAGTERGALSGRPICTQEAREQRAFEERQADRAYHATERARESAEQNAGVRLELEGKALAGDGKYLGRGWYCFRGEKDGRARGRCHRDVIDCGVLLAEHQVKGIATDLQRCEEYAQAACFQATRSTKEGPRVFCFPDESLCKEGHDSVAGKDGVEAGECGFYP